MKAFFNIDNRKIGSDYEPLLIAEIGINHGGSLQVAKSMVDAAYRAGIEVVKHQTHIPSDEYSIEGANSIPGNANISIVEIMENCALCESEEYELYKYTKQKGMIFISTPFSLKALHRILDFDLPAIKVGSGECSNYPLLKKIGETNKPIILSTGMNNIKSIKKAIGCFSQQSNIALLHTTNIYPTPHEFVRLSAMVELNKHFPDFVYGLSDHTTDSISSLGAVALGSSIIEKHFSDTRYRKGPDIICSMDPCELKFLIDRSKEIFTALNTPKIRSMPENEVYKFARGSVVADRDINIGEEINSKDIWARRPGSGEISVDDFEKLIGLRTNRFIKKNMQLEWKFFER